MLRGRSIIVWRHSVNTLEKPELLEMRARRARRAAFTPRSYGSGSSRLIRRPEKGEFFGAAGQAMVVGEDGLGGRLARTAA